MLDVRPLAHAPQVPMDADTYIRRLLDPYLARLSAAGSLIAPAKEPPFDPSDAGVPPEMVDLEIAGSDWVRWKVIPSRVQLSDIERLESRAGGPFPPLFRAFLQYAHVLSLESGGVRLPSLPSDNALGDLSGSLSSWASLASAGFVAFGDDLNDKGPICFDCARRLPDGDCPIVLFDHDELFSLGETGAGHRESDVRLAREVAPSFTSLLERIVAATRPN